MPTCMHQRFAQVKLHLVAKRKKYPKCVPIAKARAMSKGQRAGAVRRKQAKANTGPTPSRAATFAKRKNAYMGGII